MGCDIHLFVERKVDGAWRPVDPAILGHVYRSYSLFNRLAGVRQNVARERGDMSEPIAQPRGLPTDSPLFHALNEDDYGDHSHSWLMVSECVDAPGREDVRHMLDDLGKLAPLESTDRLVFWFDN